MSGVLELPTMELLLLNKLLWLQTGTPKYCREVHRSMIYSTAVLAATYSDPKVAVSTVACFWNSSQLGSYLLNVGCQ